MTTPTPDHLRQYLAGLLPLSQAEAVSEWAKNDPLAEVLLAECPDDDSIANLLSHASEEWPDEAQISRLVESTVRGMMETPVQTPDSLVTPAKTNTYDGPVPSGEAGQRFPAPEQVIPGYKLVREIGRGGMGVVYEGVDLQLERRVAVKLMLSKNSECERFLREARAAAAVKSDHVVTVFQVGVHAGAPYIVMEYLEGETLESWLKRQTNPVSAEQLTWVAGDVLSGLADVHGKGFIHRDIKPSNLWVEAGTNRVLLLDFGLTRTTDGKDPTHSGLTMGTPAYMAPEQATGDPTGPRTDLYSLGCVLYRMIAGKSPHQKANAIQSLASLANETPVSPASHRPDLPESLTTLIKHLISKPIQDRPADAKTAREILRQIDRELRSTLEPPPLSVREQSPVTPLRASRFAVAARLGLVLTVILCGFVIIQVTGKDGKVTEIKVPVPDDAKTVKLVNGENSKSVLGLGSPLDDLDSNKIPSEEREWFDVPELVAVIGEHRQRMPYSIQGLCIRPDGRQVTAVLGADEIAVMNSDMGMPKRHPIQCQFAAYLPDNRTMVMPPGVWDVTGQKPEQIGLLPDCPADCCRVSGDGRWVLAWDALKATLHDLKDLRKPKLVHTWPKMNAGAISSDGKQIALCSWDDRIVKLFRLEGMEIKQVGTLEGKDSRVWEEKYVRLPPFQFSRDGLLGVCHADGLFRLWKVNDEKPVILSKTSDPMTASGFHPVFSTDGKMVMIGNARQLSLWKIETDRLQPGGTTAINDRTGSDLGGMVFAPNGESFFSGHLSGAIRKWVIKDGTLQEADPLPVNADSGFKLSANDSVLAVRGDDTQLWHIRLTGTKPTKRLVTDPGDLLCRELNLGIQPAADPMKRRVRWKDFSGEEIAGVGEICCFSSDAGHVLVKRTDAAGVTEMAIFTANEEMPKAACEWVRVKAFSRGYARWLPDQTNGRFLLVNHPYLLELWKLDNGRLKLMDSISFDGHAFAISGFTADGKEFFFDGYRWAVEGGKMVKKPWPPGIIQAHSCSPDGRFIVSNFAFVKVHDGKSGKLLHEWLLPGRPQDIRFATDSRHLLVHGYNGVVYVFRLASR